MAFSVGDFVTSRLNKDNPSPYGEIIEIYPPTNGFDQQWYRIRWNGDCERDIMGEFLKKTSPLILLAHQANADG